MMQEAPTSTTALRSERLAIGYAAKRGQTTVVANELTLELRRGEIVCLLGPNGAGKSTLIRTLVGMQRPLQGTIWLDTHEVQALSPSERARYISVVLTDRVDAPALSVWDLIALGRFPHTTWSGRLTETDRRAIEQAIASTHIGHLAQRKVNQLSDGERQRVMITRALAQEPLLLALDEPTAFLDLPRRVEIMVLLRKIAHSSGRAVLVSTHDLEIALRIADRLWLMPGGGPLSTGIPEQLVLDGTFGAIFQAPGISFDITRGTFRIESPFTASVCVRGQGAAAHWTIQACERAGLRVLPNAAADEATLYVYEAEAQPRWEVVLRGQAITCQSLEAALNTISRMLQQGNQ